MSLLNNLLLPKVVILLLSYAIVFIQVMADGHLMGDQYNDEFNSPATLDNKLQEVTIVTDDNVKLSAKIGIPEGNKKKYPALIFIHQGGSNKSEWVNTNVFKILLQSGYIVLAYDVRTFGKSEHDDLQSNIYNDPNRAPKDLMAALAYLREERKDVEDNNIGVIGSSIGGNLACVASSDRNYGIKTAIAISCKTAAVLDLTGNSKRLKMANVFLISSENDQGGARAKWAKELYDMADEPKKISIVTKSAAHGVGMFNPKLESEIVQWINNTMK